MNKKVLITGITGFLGSSLVRNLIDLNFDVYGLKRKSSDIWRCAHFEKNVTWINIEDDLFFDLDKPKIYVDILIHAAWIGVSHVERYDFCVQNQNVEFLELLLKRVIAKKIIGLGSQEEYGIKSNKISESEIANPISYYGKAKIECLNLVNRHVQKKKIEFIWLRIFTIFGEGESGNWLIPQLIYAMKKLDHLDLTYGEQKYAYLYIQDFSSILTKIVCKKIDSGIYNVSSNQVLTIKEIVLKIQNIVNKQFQLNFGALAYRENQAMHIEGNILKLVSQIGEIEFTDFDLALSNTVNYHLNKI